VVSGGRSNASAAPAAQTAAAPPCTARLRAPPALRGAAIVNRSRAGLSRRHNVALSSASYCPISGEINRWRASARRMMFLNALLMLSLGPAAAHAETFKCTDAYGKTVSQAAPCQATAEETLKFQAPAPAATSSTQPAGVSHAPRDRVPTEADFRGPRETWDRLTQAVARGDKDAALKELTPSAQQRLAAVFDTIGSKSAPLTADELGSIRSVMLAGNGLATLKLTRKKSDGTYAHDVMLIRDADGKWRIDNM